MVRVMQQTMEQGSAKKTPPTSSGTGVKKEDTTGQEKPTIDNTFRHQTKEKIQNIIGDVIGRLFTRMPQEKQDSQQEEEKTQTDKEEEAERTPPTSDGNDEKKEDLAGTKSPTINNTFKFQKEEQVKEIIEEIIERVFKEKKKQQKRETRLVTSNSKGEKASKEILEKIQKLCKFPKTKKKDKTGGQ